MTDLKKSKKYTTIPNYRNHENRSHANNDIEVLYMKKTSKHESKLKKAMLGNHHMGCGDAAMYPCERHCTQVCHVSNAWYTGPCCHPDIAMQPDCSDTQRKLPGVVTYSYTEAYKTIDEIYVPKSRDHKNKSCRAQLKATEHVEQPQRNDEKRKRDHLEFAVGKVNETKQKNHDNYVRHYKKHQNESSNSNDITVIKAAVPRLKESKMDDNVRMCILRSCMKVPLPPSSSEEDERTQQQRQSVQKKCLVIKEIPPVEPLADVRRSAKNPELAKPQPQPHTKLDVQMGTATGPVSIHVKFTKDREMKKKVYNERLVGRKTKRKPPSSENEERFYDAPAFPTARKNKEAEKSHDETGTQKPTLEELYEDYLQHTWPSTRFWRTPPPDPFSTFVKNISYPIIMLKEYIWG